MNRVITALLGLCCLAYAACQAGSNRPEHRFALEGIVVAVDKQGRQVTIAHKEIPGYMAAMTMPFSVKDEWALSVLAPGRYLRATLVVDGGRSWLEEIVVTEPSRGVGPDAGLPLPPILLRAMKSLISALSIRTAGPCIWASIAGEPW